MFIAWIWMGLLILIPLFVLFSLLKYLLGKNKNERSNQPNQETSTPLDILKTSYARGELSREEFLQKREDLLKK